MPRPKTPKNVLELRGSYRKHPERKRTQEPVDRRQIKRIRRKFTTEKAAYDSIVATAIPGVLTRADAPSVWLAAKLMVKIDTADYTTSDVSALTKLFTQFGMTPASRVNLSIPEPPKKNRFADDDDFSEFERPEW